MKRTIYFLLAVAIMGLIGWLPLGWTGQPQEVKLWSQRGSVTLTNGDNGKEIEVRQGDLVRVELESPGATGYLWQLGDLDRSRLDLVNQSTRTLLRDGKVGGPVLTVFCFRAVSEGSVMLMIDFFRPWEGRAKSERRFLVKIKIP